MNEVLQKRESEPKPTAVPIMISGLPGKMATLVAEEVSRNPNYFLLETSMSSKRHKRESLSFGNNFVRLDDYCPLDLPPGSIAIDYTTASVVAQKVLDYTTFRIPFVMGTTVKDLAQIVDMVRNSSISAVIAPNMALSVVGLQSELSNLRANSPGCYDGWKMKIRESHQATKVDAEGKPIVSGTAIALVESFGQLGAVMDGEIESVRDPKVQTSLGIQNLDGHAYHWVTLTGPDGETREHIIRIEGRQPYVEGTLMAVDFLRKKIAEDLKGEVYTMIDVVEDMKEVAA